VCAGRTPLHAAAMHGQVEVSKLLIKMGAKLDARDNQKMTPEEVAASHGVENEKEYLQAAAKQARSPRAGTRTA